MATKKATRKTTKKAYAPAFADRRSGSDSSRLLKRLSNGKPLTITVIAGMFKAEYGKKAEQHAKSVVARLALQGRIRHEWTIVREDGKISMKSTKPFLKQLAKAA